MKSYAVLVSRSSVRQDELCQEKKMKISSGWKYLSSQCLKEVISNRKPEPSLSWKKWVDINH